MMSPNLTKFPLYPTMNNSDVKYVEKIFMKFTGAVTAVIICMAFLIYCLFLTGCATTEPVPVLHNVCLPMVTYTPQQQAQAANELQKLGPKSELAQMIVDYGRLRAGNRKCLSMAK